MSNHKSNAKSPSVDDFSTFRTIVNLWPYIWPHDRSDLRFRVVLSFLALFAAKIVTVLVPYCYKWATDALNSSTTGDFSASAIISVPIMLVVAYGVGRTMQVLFNQLRDALFAKVGQHAVRRLANRTFTHLHHLSLRFHLQRRTGALNRIIERGTKGIESIVKFTILATVPTGIEFLLMAGVIWFQFGLHYVVIIIATILFYVVFTVKTTNWRIKIRKRMNESDSEANSKAIDSLLNFETVKYFNNENLEASRFDKSMASYESSAVRTWESLALLNIGQSVIYTIGMTLCMLLSGYSVLEGNQTVGDFVMINALMMQLAMPLNAVGFVYREIRQGLTDIGEMFNILDVSSEIRDAPNAEVLRVNGGAVKFEDVSFHYDSDRQILNNISFEVPAGKKVAIVGPSGAGKSTLSRLIFRFYDVTEGRITVDGQDVRDVQMDSLRQAIGIVPQDTVLFNASILYNIRYGRADATDREVKEAAQAAQIAEFVESLPMGYETAVGERGLKLSGGEKQRVAIARTILKSPPILIFDEATSALDTQTEREIQSALDRISETRTTLVIAHRLSTVVNSDMILVLESGRIVEQGVHQELLDRGGLYASMWARQREVDEAEQKLRAARSSDELGNAVNARSEETGVLETDRSPA